MEAIIVIAFLGVVVRFLYAFIKLIIDDLRRTEEERDEYYIKNKIDVFSWKMKLGDTLMIALVLYLSTKNTGDYITAIVLFVIGFIAIMLELPYKHLRGRIKKEDSE